MNGLSVCTYDCLLLRFCCHLPPTMESAAAASTAAAVLPTAAATVETGPGGATVAPEGRAGAGSGNDWPIMTGASFPETVVRTDVVIGPQNILNATGAGIPAAQKSLTHQKGGPQLGWLVLFITFSFLSLLVQGLCTMTHFCPNFRNLVRTASHKGLMCQVATNIGAGICRCHVERKILQPQVEKVEKVARKAYKSLTSSHKQHQRFIRYLPAPTTA